MLLLRQHLTLIIMFCISLALIAPSFAFAQDKPTGSTLISDFPEGSALRGDLDRLPPHLRARALAQLFDLRINDNEIIEGIIRAGPRGNILYADKFDDEPVVDQESGPRRRAAVQAMHRVQDGISAQQPPAFKTAEDVFKLHSKPGASSRLYIDFTGPVIENTVWNLPGWRDESFTEGTQMPLDTLPYRSDRSTYPDAPGSARLWTGDSFEAHTDEDIQSMFSIWRMVAEDYAPFDIDVTTERPDDLDRRTIHAVVTFPFIEYTQDAKRAVSMPFHWAGGVAYVSTFGLPAQYDAFGELVGGQRFLGPALIYHLGDENRTASTISHEAGHQLSLEHWGTESRTYYNGHGDGDDTWGPIMGGGYWQQYTQWSDGTYPGAVLHSSYPALAAQDDVSRIAKRLGVVADDHSDTIKGATPIASDKDGAINVITPTEGPVILSNVNKGVIESRQDVDVFSVEHLGGSLALLITTANEAHLGGANIDIAAELLNADGKRIANSNMESVSYAQINQVLDAGTYYLRVFGAGNVEADFSDYGSLGQYFISGKLGDIKAVGDTTAPVPGRSGWVGTPFATSDSALQVTARQSFDVSAVEYQIKCVNDSNECGISDAWQASPLFNVDDLTLNGFYSFAVRSRDSNGNLTSWSSVASQFLRDPNACPNTVYAKSHPAFGLMWNSGSFTSDPGGDGDERRPELVANWCVTQGNSCTSFVWYNRLGLEDSGERTTLYCNDNIWTPQAPVADLCPNSLLMNNKMWDNAGQSIVPNLCSTDEKQCQDVWSYPDDDRYTVACDGASWQIVAGTGASGDAPDVEPTDLCPNTVLSQTRIWNNAGSAIVPNACVTQGVVCSTWVTEQEQFSDVECDGNKWVIPAVKPIH